jgi:succinyldiaminopimelate transaminase
VNERLRDLPPYPIVQLDSWIEEVAARGGTVYDFGAGDPREPTPKILRQAMIDGVDEVSQYPPTSGMPGLRTAVADYMSRRFGVALDADQEVLASYGNKEALFHLPMTFVQIPSEKDLVLYGEPACPVYEIGALFAEAWTYSVQLGPHNDYAMDPDSLPESVLKRAAIVYLNYPHNPSGHKLSDELYKRWVEVRAEYGFILVSDECCVDLSYEGDPPRSLLEFGREGCLVMHSLSQRSGMTGYRSGFIAGDADLISKYRRFRACMGTVPQSFVQAAAELAWTDTKHVEDRLAVLLAKREVLLQMASDRGLKVHGSQAGLYLWLELPPGTSDLEYAALCRDNGIVVAPGSFFGKSQEQFIRVALAPTIEECRAAVDVWPKA